MASDYKNGEGAVQKRILKANRKEDQSRMVRITVRKHVEQGSNIYTVAQVQKMTRDKTGENVTGRQCTHVLKKDFKMRFRKIREVAFQGNRERNLALRCMFAKKLLEVLSAGKRVINIDETWLNQL